MTRVRGLLGAAALLLLAGGCNSYHYFDITVDFGSVSFEEAGGIKRCEVFVSGADTDNFVLPSTGAKRVACPIDSNWPELGTFEYSTFTDSGSLTFTMNAYNMTPPMDSYICVSGATTLSASSAITQTATITLAQGNQTCITP
ncbi:MAG TPA: hypothetical protein VMT03_06280 [Polyangia bacterium]|nr:hypothetical protein [Polyangia bacterium]